MESGGTAAVGAGAGDEAGTLGGSGGAGGTGGAGGLGGTGDVGGMSGSNGRGGSGTAGTLSATDVRLEPVDFRITIQDCDSIAAECAYGVRCGDERHGFVVRDGDDLVLVYAGQGELEGMKLWPEDVGFSTNLSASLDVLDERAGPRVSLQAGPFDVQLVDEDADGVAEAFRLEGPGTCHNTNGSDPYYGTSEVDKVVLAAHVTTSAPHWEVHGDGWYEPLELWSDQPLALSSTGTLVAADGTSRAAKPVAGSWRTGGNDEFLRAFSVAEDLPRDTELTWQLDAANTAGGLAPRSVSFHTEQAWVPLGELGFEDGVDAHVVGSADHGCNLPAELPRTLSAIGSLAALEGQASLFVPAGLDVAILLDRPAGATKLTLKSMPLHWNAYADLPTFGIRTRRGKAVVEAPWANDSRGGFDNGADQYAQAGIEHVVELTLPEQGDLLLEIHTTCETDSSEQYATGAWVDALEFE